MLRQWSVGGRALNPLHGVYRQDVLLPIQFETEFAEREHSRFLRKYATSAVESIDQIGNS